MRVSTNQLFFGTLDRILDLQARSSEIQKQVTTGRRVNQPGDDPVAAAAILQIDERLRAMDQYDRNGVQAEARLGQIDDTLGAVSGVLQRVRELLIQGRSEALNDGDRRAVAAEVRENLDTLVDLGNTRNASGEYIFAGSMVTTRPFTRDVTGTVSYNGDQTARSVQISETRALPEGFNGAEVLFQVRNGNGTFVTSLGAGNGGTAQVSDNIVTDPTAVTGHDYRISFTAPGTFDVIDDTLGANVLTGQTYVDGQGIAFDGMEITVFGTPAAGDEFGVAPSANQSLFDTFDRIATTLEAGFDNPAEAARFGFELDRAIEAMDASVEKVASIRAETGSRLASIEAQRNFHEDLGLNLETLRSKLEDVDLTEAISLLAQQTTALEAAQAAFVRVQSLSLFNFL